MARSSTMPVAHVDRLLAENLRVVGQLAEPKSVAFITCSYDTSFEDVTFQVCERVRQIEMLFAAAPAIQWALWVVDDLPDAQGFTTRVEAAFQARPDLLKAGRLHCVPMRSMPRRIGGLKGAALLDGMRAALDEDAYDAFTYLNLNLKVDARFAGLGVAAVLAGQWEAAIGSRAMTDSGLACGAGTLGRLKSRVYSRIARSALPPLMDFTDTNAPMKVFSRSATRYLTSRAQIHQVTLDCEWLIMMHEGQFSMGRFPVIWIQRAGSRPPWHLILRCLRDVYRIRRAWRRGDYT
ncbi:MAG: hypothetical protein VX589_16420 [Myxococcota bacterium]|nr:hypothetical protein [Myxococcota bacterium]